MAKKFEKITLITCIETYGSKHAAGMTALDELLPLIEEYSVEVTLIDYDIKDEYELVKKADTAKADVPAA
jgi:hypothetical protein